MTSPKASHRAFAADLFIAGKSILNEVLLQEKHTKKRRNAGKGQGEGEKRCGDHFPSPQSSPARGEEDQGKCCS
jgi:hypothetical protein